MRFHPLAVSVVVGALASSSFSSSSTVVDAFVVPTSISQTTAQRYLAKSKKTARFLGDDGFGDSPYVSLDDDTPASSSSSSSSPSLTTTTTTKRKPNARVENRRAQLEADLAAAEESKARTAQQLSEAEEFRSSLAAQEARAIKEAEALDAKLKAFEAKQAKAAKTGGSIFGTIGEIAGTFTAVVAARAALAERSQKVEEERLRKEEQQRIAEEKAEKLARQQNSNKNVLPIVVGTVGLGAFGAFFGGGIGGGGGESIVNSMSKNALRNAIGNQQAMINQQQSVGSDNSPTVEMPYLEKQIAKAETKSKQKRISTRPKSKRTLAREAAEEQKAVEARLEARLADAPDREAAEVEAQAAAESATAEEIKVEAERKALLERQEAERKLAEEKIAAEQKLLEEKQRIAAEERAKADKLSTENRIKIENEARIKAEKEAKEKEEAQINAEKLDAAKREAVALELLKQQNAESNGFFPKVPAVSEMLFGDKKPSQVTDKGLSNIFNGIPIVVGGVALAGIAVAAAIVAANESPSVSSTFKVTGKTPKDYMESPDATPTPAPRGTVRIPQPGETISSSLPSQSKNTLRDELSKQRANINQQAAEKSSIASSPSSDSANSFAPPPTKKSFSPYGSMKPRAASSDPLSASMTPTVTASSPAFAETDASSSSWSLSTSDTAATGASYLEDMGSGGQSDVPLSAKKSFSPFGGKKPISIINDSLSSNTASQDLMGGGGNINNPVFQSSPVSPQPSILEPDSSGPVSLLLNGSYMDTIGAGSSSAAPKRSFSPYGSSKPVAAKSDSLYSAPASQISETQVPMPTMTTESTYIPSNGLDTSDIGGVGPIASTPGKSYSPFQGSKPVAATNDYLYSAPSVQRVENESNNYDIPEIESSYRAPDSSSFAPNVSPPRKNYSPFGGAKPVAAGSDSLYSAPGGGTEESSTSTMPFAASGLDDTSTVFPETTAFRATAAVKKSFSPFGFKPAAPSKPNNNGGGYLDEL